MTARRVLSVGQCMADHSRISHVLRRVFAAEVVAADTAGEVLQQMREEVFDLVLVNRVFDADSDSGVEFIRQVKSDEKLGKTPVMLVSNYEDAQAQAVAAGAQEGFGKASLQAPRTVELLRGT